MKAIAISQFKATLFGEFGFLLLGFRRALAMEPVEQMTDASNSSCAGGRAHRFRV